MVKVLSVEAIDNHRLRVSLSNNRKGVFDVKPYLNRGIFRELKDEQYFRRVRVAYGGVVWPHEQDFSPETIEYELQEERALKKAVANDTTLRQALPNRSRLSGQMTSIQELATLTRARFSCCTI